MCFVVFVGRSKMSYSMTRHQASLQHLSVYKPFFLLVIFISIVFSGSAFAQWQKQTNLIAQPLIAVAVDPIDDKIFVGVGKGQNTGEVPGLYSSSGTLAQKSWSSSVTGNAVRSIGIAPDNTFNNKKMFIAVDGQGILKSTNGGLTWTASNIVTATQVSITSNIAQIVISKNVNNVQKIYALVDVDFDQRPGTKGVYVSGNDGLTWTKLVNLFDAKKIAVVADQPNTLIVSTNSGDIKKSTDGGNNFVAANSGLPQAGLSDHIIDFAIDPMNSSNMYASIFQQGVPSVSGLYYSNNGGVSWTLQSAEIFYHLTVSAISTVSNKVYGIRNENTQNNGNPFHNVFVSTNHGQTMAKLDIQNTGLSGQNMNAVTVVNNKVYVAAVDGLYINDEGQTNPTTNPIASNETVNVPAGSTTASGVLQGVKVNPTDTLVFSLVSNGTKGTMQISTSGSYTYTAFANSTGTDTVTFRVTDQLSRTSLVNGVINISFGATGGNTNPTALNSIVNVTTATVSGSLQATKVVATDTLTFTVVVPSTKGTFQLTNVNTGRFTYTPTIGQTGTDRVTFNVRDQLNRLSSNATLTLNLPISGGGTGVDLAITATPTTTSVQPGGELTVNLSIRNVSTVNTTQSITVSTSQLPVGVALAQGSNASCTLSPTTRVVTCLISTVAAGLTQTVPIVLRMPTPFSASSLQVTYTATVVGDANTLNNSTTVTTTVGTSGGGGSTIPLAQTSSINVVPGSDVRGAFTVSKVSPTDTLTYFFMRDNDTTKGTFSFITPVVGIPNQSTSPEFRYAAKPGAAGLPDRINFKAIDQLGRESVIASITVNFQNTNNSPSGASSSSSGGAINPLFMLMGLLPFMFRRRKN